MLRKVVKHGPSTMIVSLPIKWIKKNNVQKGAELNVDEENNKIIIGIEKEPEIKEIKTDISDLDRTAIMYHIRALYRKGYDEIKMKFNNQSTIYFRSNKTLRVISVIHEEVNRLIGFEVMQEKENFCIIQDISASTIKDFDSMLRRIFLLLCDASEELLNGAKRNDKALIGSIEEKHNTITKFVSYCLRSLNKKDYKESEKTSIIYHIIATLDKITDILKYAARSMLTFDERLDDEGINILEKITGSLNLYYKLFYKFDKETVSELNKKRYIVEAEIKKRLKEKSKEEDFLLVSMDQILELLLDITEARTSIEF